MPFQYQVPCYDVLLVVAGYYKDVMSQLKEKQQKSGGEAAHPKVAAFVKEMSKARSLIDPNDNDLKVLVVARREGQWVYQLLHQHIGEKRVTHLISPIDYHKVLHVLEEASVVVWEEDNGLQQLPCSQFSLVVEWEAGGEASPCVRQCVRQNIRVVSFNLAPVIGDKGSEVDEAGEGSTTEHIKDKRSKRRRKKSDSGREELRIIASSTITANSELHYILTSIYNITLTERSLGDVSEEDEGERGWPDLVLDERTCVILKPLSLLRSDLHLNQLTHRVALLSQQCTACYIILYSNPASNSGYEFRSSVLRALVRLVAVCALLRSQDYTVSLLLANSLHHVGLMVRQVCEAARNVSPVWDHEEWNIRPWLTAHMSVHERFLLTLPCINSMSAQIILTAMSLTEVLTQPLSHLLKCLPWIPQKVVKRLHHHVHEDSPIAATSSFHTNQREGGGTTCDPTKTDLTHKTEEADPYHSTTHTAITAAHPHGDYNMERTYNNTVLPYTTGVGVNTVVAASAHPSNLFSVSSSSNIQPSFPTEPEFCAALPSSYSYSTHLSSQNDLTKNAATLHSNGSFNNSSEAAPCTFYNTDRSQVHAQKEISNGTVVLPGSINDMSEYGASTFSNSNRTSSHQMTAHDPKPVASVSHYSSFDSNEDDKKFTVPFQSNTGSSLNYVEPFSGTVVKTEESSTDLFNPQEYLHSLCYSDVALGERGLWPQPQYQVPVESAYNPHGNSCYVRNISDNRGLAPASQNWHMGLAAAHESHIAPVQNMYVGSSQVCHSVIENLERTNQPRAVQPLYYNPREEGADANQKVCREIMCSEQTPWQQQKPGEQTSHLTGYWYRSSHPGNYNTRVYGIATPQQREREGMMVSVPPTPHVTMRQPGRGHDFPSHYNLTPSQTTHSRAGSKGMNGDMGRLAYERVPGKGGQTQLIFK
ncbi:hypothetical protein Pmani_031564 [Petrolisthes manimaculis]|uniref:Uncharacterized protein n=1 Tax=Petrolisthes manimaculis TaxID=1843537 RepID=A0AAE1TRV1_9EUCA|nr:hypothetical protein Pmani_031564 [Petrolisthes manimaculis]